MKCHVPEMNERSSVESTFEQCRAFLTAEVKLRKSQYAKVVPLRVSSPQFENDVIEAIVLSVTYHLAPKPTKFSVLREQMVRVDEAAISAAEKLHALQATLEQVEQMYRDALLNQQPKIVATPFRMARSVEALSHRAHLYWRGFAGEGGAPKMVGFRMLVQHLAGAFQRAVGRAAKVTWNAYDKRYGGDFVNFFEALLPIALECAQQLGPKMPCPGNARARGKYIFELTRSARRKK
jgi:hypothetical protein